METFDYFLLAALICVVIAFHFVAKWFKKKASEEPRTCKAILLYFHETVWLCNVIREDGSAECGFLSLSETDHFPGEEVDVDVDGVEIMVMHIFKTTTPKA